MFTAQTFYADRRNDDDPLDGGLDHFHTPSHSPSPAALPGAKFVFRSKDPEEKGGSQRGVRRAVGQKHLRISSRICNCEKRPWKSGVNI